MSKVVQQLDLLIYKLFQPTVTGRDVRWVSSGVTLKATEGEIKLTKLIKEKLDPTYLSVVDVSCGKSVCV